MTLGNREAAMNTETTSHNGWRCSWTWSSPESGRTEVTVELDKNLGATWPHVAIVASARLTEDTMIRVAKPSIGPDEFTGASGIPYRRGIDEYCVGAIAEGASRALRTDIGFEVDFTSGGVGTDTSEIVSGRAAEIATALLLAELTEPRPLKDVVAETVASWTQKAP